MTTIANLGIKVSSDGIDKTDIALGKLAASSARSEAAIDRMIESIKKQNMILNSGKAAFTDYAMTAMGASEAEKKLATDIIKTTESIKASRASAAKQVKDNLAETKRAGAEQLKAINDIEKAEAKRISSINKVIESLSKEEKALKMSKSEQAQYNLALLGASEAEKKAAQNIIDRISAIKSAKKAEDDATRAINESKIAKDKLIDAEKKRRDSVNTTIMKLRDEVAVLGKSDAQLLRYKLTLAGATEAEKKQALALQKTVKEYRESSDAAKKHDGTLMSLAKRVSALALIYGTIRTIKQFGDSLIETALIADNYKYSLQAVSTSNEVAAESYKYLKSESERLGLSITGQADSFVSFAASAKAAKMTVDETRASYTGLSEAIAAMHRSPEQAAAALNALQQMLGKGTVQSEELVRQLSNSLPGAVPLFADAMGVSVAALKGLMKDGLLPADIAVKAFTNFLSNQFQTAAETASIGIQGSLNRMQNATYAFKGELVKALGSEGLNLIVGFTDEIKSMTKTLASPEGQEALKEMAGGIKAIGQAALWTMQKVTSLANAFGESARVSREGIDLIKAGTIDQDAFFKASYEEKKKLIKEAGTVEDEHVLKFKINAEETLRVTEEQLVKDKALIQASLKKKEADSAVTRERESNAKSLATMQENEIKRAAQIGKTDAEKAKMDALALGAGEKQAQAIYELVKANDAKEASIQAGIEAEKKAISEREAMEKKAESDLAAMIEKKKKTEDDRQGRIDAVIEKLREEIATYKQGEEVSAEYALAQDHASTTEMALAKSLGETIDNLKEKTAAQKHYNTVMDKVSPDKVELNREKGIQAVNRAMEAGVNISGGYEAGLKRVNDYFDKIEETAADKRLEEIGKELDDLTSFDGSTFGNTIADGINNAVTSMNDLLEVYDKNAKAQKEIKKLQDELATGEGSPEVRAEKLKDLDKYETAMVKNQISGYRQLFGTASQLFDENTKERENMHNAEMAFAAIELAMNLKKAISNAVVSVTSAGSGDPYTAIPRVLAMAALMAGILSQIGGSISGAGSSPTVPAKATSQSGTVLGDDTTSSQSLENIESFFEDMHVEDYTQLKGIYSEMKDLNNNITGLVSSIFRGGTGKFTPESMGIDLSDKMGAVEQFSRDIILFPSFLDKISSKVGDWISSGLGEIFGGGSESSVTAQGISTSNAVKIGDLIGGSIIDTIKFADIKTETEGGWFHSDSTDYSRRIEDLGTEVDNLFTQVFSSLGKSFISVAEILGKDAQTVKDYVFKIGDIDLKNLETADEINEALNAAISTISDEAATALFGTLIGQYQTVGEGMVETAVRVASEKIMVLDTLDKLGTAFESADIPALAIAFSQSLLDVAGGLEDFIDITSTYYDKFFTDEEKQADIAEMLTESLQGFDLELPGTRELYRGLIEGIDKTDEANQKAIITLLELSGSADEYYSYLEDADEKAKDAAQAAKDALEDMSNAILTGIDNILVASGRMTEEDIFNRDFTEKYKVAPSEAHSKQAIDFITSASQETIIALAGEFGVTVSQMLQDINDEASYVASESLKAKELAEVAEKTFTDMVSTITEGINNILISSGKMTSEDIFNRDFKDKYGVGPSAEHSKEAVDFISTATPETIIALADEFGVTVSQMLQDINTEAVNVSNAALKAKELAAQKTQLDIQIMELTGDASGALAARREIELAAMDETLRPLQSLIYGYEDAAEAAQVAAAALEAADAKTAQIAENKAQLEISLMTAMGDTAGALAATRAAEIAAMDETLRPLQQLIWSYNDASEAASKAADLLSQKAQLEIQIMELEGNSAGALAATRAIELDVMDESLRPLQERINHLEDEKIAAEEAAKAAEEMINVWNASRDAAANIAGMFGDVKKDRYYWHDLINRTAPGGDTSKKYSIEGESSNINIIGQILDVLKPPEIIISPESISYGLNGNNVNIPLPGGADFNVTNKDWTTTGNLNPDTLAGAGFMKGIFSSIEDLFANYKNVYGEAAWDETATEKANSPILTLAEFRTFFENATITPAVTTPAWDSSQAIEKLFGDFTLADIMTEFAGEFDTETAETNLLNLNSVLTALTTSGQITLDYKNTLMDAAYDAYNQFLEEEAEKLNVINDLKDKYVSRLESELDILKGNLDTAKSTYLGLLNEEADVQDKLASSLKSAINSIKDYRKSLFGIDGAADQQDYLRSRQASLAASVSGGNVDDTAELIDISGKYLEVSQQTSKTSIEYKREIAITNTLLHGVQGKLENQITEAENQAQHFKDLIAGVNGVGNEVLTLAQAEYAYNAAKDALDNNWYAAEISALKTIDQSVLSLRDAFVAAGGMSTYKSINGGIGENTIPQINTSLGGYTSSGGSIESYNQKAYQKDVGGNVFSNDAYVAWKEANADKLYNPSNIPGFASGGYHSGGLAFTGERGVELSYRPPSQIMSNSDMMTELSNKEVVKKLNELIAEVNKGNYAIANNTREAAKTLKKFDYDGIEVKV